MATQDKNMFKGLLAYSLERISSLYHFYKSELPSIKRKSNQGMNLNRLGYIADLYFYFLKTGTGDKELLKTAKKNVEKHLDVKVDNENGETRIFYKFKDLEQLRDKGIETNIEEASVAYSKFEDMPIIHANNTLVMLITRFEEFISNFLKELFEMFPKKYLDDKQISFSEIVGNDLSAIRQKIVIRAVDGEMRKSYLEWFKIFEDHKMKFDRCKEEMENLKEMYVRRNVVVHNSGEANEAYLECLMETEIELGEDLTPDESYLDSAFISIKTLIFCILLEACRIVDEKESYLNNIFDIAFEQLQEKQYQICAKVFKALADYKRLSANTKLMSQVNYWISRKEMDGLYSIQEEIEEFDVTALDKIFSLAKEILLEHNDEATVILEDLYQKNEISSTELEEWPLFMHYRETMHYEDFKSRHSDDFEMSSFELKQEEITLEDGASEAIIREIEEKKLA